ncbi:polysaccharide deacetylase family protein [Desulfitobacterium sp.]|uniref:polysaccharide deacetylase family protein n=1 Tax=Desulfitobacterium sp. TaxID=49981 RepID=UPI002B1F24F1|nr:polysaccharide deacetylase family protein [Desulfitobacterium sp.]MEA4900813.1 polysaccharide deacetylase family protein [Desulfitobacterium sp.]
MRIILINRKRTIRILLLSVFMILGISFMSRSISIPSLVRTPGTYYMVNTQEKVVALTFDDGPDPNYTGFVLDVLAEKNVKATFFVLGENAQHYPELLSQIKAEGHEIGNHGYSHTYNTNQFVKELAKTDQVIFDLLQQHTYFYRPPGGFVSKEVIQGVKEKGYLLTLWSIDSKDWRNPGVTRIAETVVENVSPGAIILLHDGGAKREQTVGALKAIIDRLGNEGYRFVTLTELQHFEERNPIPTLQEKNKR